MAHICLLAVGWCTQCTYSQMPRCQSHFFCLQGLLCRIQSPTSHIPWHCKHCKWPCKISQAMSTVWKWEWKQGESIKAKIHKIVVSPVVHRVSDWLQPQPAEILQGIRLSEYGNPATAANASANRQRSEAPAAIDELKQHSAHLWQLPKQAPTPTTAQSRSWTPSHVHSSKAQLRNTFGQENWENTEKCRPSPTIHCQWLEIPSTSVSRTGVSARDLGNWVFSTGSELPNAHWKVAARLPPSVCGRCAQRHCVKQMRSILIEKGWPQGQTKTWWGKTCRIHQSKPLSFTRQTGRNGAKRFSSATLEVPTGFITGHTCQAHHCPLVNPEPSITCDTWNP